MLLHFGRGRAGVQPLNMVAVLAGVLGQRFDEARLTRLRVVQLAGQRSRDCQDLRPGVNDVSALAR